MVATGFTMIAAIVARLRQRPIPLTGSLAVTEVGFEGLVVARRAAHLEAWVDSLTVNPKRHPEYGVLTAIAWRTPCGGWVSCSAC